MRPLNFTLHAILAAAIAALAASSAAAQSPPTLRIVTETPSLPAGKGEQIEIQSFHWGPRQSTSAWELEPARITSYQLGGSSASAGRGVNQMTMDDTAGKEKLQPGGGRGTASRDMTMKGSKIGENSAGSRPGTAIGGAIGALANDGDEASGAAQGANETMTVGGGRTETAQATGKRQHMPLRTRTYYDAPLPQGSVRVKLKMPWLACRVGATYPRLELGGGGKRYVLRDVTVASCGGRSGDADDRPTEEVAFYYNTVG